MDSPQPQSTLSAGKKLEAFGLNDLEGEMSVVPGNGTELKVFLSVTLAISDILTPAFNRNVSGP